ncbi:hypothetical protein Sango_2476000 [Sesamum angolense]|uniref:DUF4216 domain-containing protein n=1 Tax=Sesamum angolense TaxID=2727404 RepID=A0AAE1W3G6_9LAMI|nr:hypothetical protein Sango_2476000 [Sesamum angolense]
MRQCEWIRGLKFSGGYASNLARCVDMTELRMHGMKSHDCHVFMKKLIPIALGEMLPEHVWSALTEYFEPDVQSKRSMPRRNDECTGSNNGLQVSIFNYPGRASGATKKRWLSRLEWHIIQTSYLNELYQHHHPTDPIIDRLSSRIGSNDVAEVTSFNAYFVNGYNFQTERHNTGKSTMNCRVYVKSSLYTDEENDFYGIIEEIYSTDIPTYSKLAHRAVQISLVDLVRGMKVHQSYHLVDVNFKKLYQKDDPFILAQQAVQVYFTEYLSTSQRPLHENVDENEDEDEDEVSGGDDETDDEEYEAT